MSSTRVPKLDEKDYLILRILALDSMVSLKDISEQVGLSSPAVSVRVQRLKSTGVISPGVRVDFGRFGLRRYTLGLTLRTGIPADSRDRVIGKFLEEPAIISIWTTSGEHDLVLHAVFGSSYDLMYFIDKKIRPITEISSIGISEMLEAVKRECRDTQTSRIHDIPIPYSPREKHREQK